VTQGGSQSQFYERIAVSSTSHPVGARQNDWHVISLLLFSLWVMAPVGAAVAAPIIVDQRGGPFYNGGVERVDADHCDLMPQ
jgi:hypothetical protein